LIIAKSSIQRVYVSELAFPFGLILFNFFAVRDDLAIMLTKQQLTSIHKNLVNNGKSILEICLWEFVLVLVYCWYQVGTDNSSWWKIFCWEFLIWEMPEVSCILPHKRLLSLCSASL